MAAELKWESKKKFYLVGSLLVLIFSFYLILRLEKSVFNIQEKDLTTISELEIYEKLVFVKRNGKGTSPHIEIKFKNYSKIFAIDGCDYDCSLSDSTIINENKIGDKVSIKILNDTYKELKANEIYPFIRIHSLINKKKEYLDLECRNKEQKNDDKLGIIICIIMSPILFIIGLLKKEPKIWKIETSIWLALLLLILVFTIRRFI